MKKTTFALTIISMATAMLIASCTRSAQKYTTELTAADSTDIVIENIMTRTSVRQFTSRPIAHDTLETIVKTGMAAPTAMNRQPWAFIVITEKEILDSLQAVHPYSNLKTATAAIIVCGDMEKTNEGFSREYWIQDCSAATENILLAAHAFGLGAVWCGVFPNPGILPEIRRQLNLPNHIIPLNLITMGYPANPSQPKDKWNPDNIHFQKW